MPEEERVVEVVAWRDTGDAVLRLPALQQLVVARDGELAISTLVDEIRARTGLVVALIALTDSHAHVELLEPASAAVSGWCAPDIELDAETPWNTLGWYPAVCSTIERTLESRGMARTGPFVQRKHWSISAILSVTTDDGELWFKQVPPFMAHEGRVMQWLSRLRPGAVPELVDVGPDWSLTRAFPAPREEPALANPFGLLAELQQRATDRVDELFELGCPDRRHPQLLRDVEALCARDDLLDSGQQRALANALPALAEHCARLDRGAVAPTLVHGDLHGGNWTSTGVDEWMIFDWTDACVAHPFVDLGVLPTKDESIRAARLQRYVDAWRPHDPDVERTVADALPVAAAHHAVSYQRIVDNVGHGDAASWHPAVRHHLDAMHRLL